MVGTRSLGRFIDNTLTSLDLTIAAPVGLVGIGFGIIGVNFKVG